MNDSTSVRNVNLLYLVAFLTLFLGSLVVPAISLGWRVVINELAFLGLPLALYLVIARPDLRDTLRLRGVSWLIAGLSLLVGLGIWRLDAWLATVVNQALDYTIPLPPEALNVTRMDNVAMVVGTAVFAPVVEELLFRGVIQSTYERRGPLRAIAASTLLFVLIHQEASQTVALVPVALALGYVTWRTQSILPAMLIHAGNNAQAMLLSLVAEGGAQRFAFTPSLAGALVGAAIAAAALWLLTRRTRAPQREREPVQPSLVTRRWLARNWPIVLVVPIYAVVLGLSLLIGARPEALALGQRVELASAPWEEETHWRYEVRNVLDEPVGEAECSLAPQPDVFVLDCSMEQLAYEADAPTGFFKEGEVTQRQTVRWDRRTLTLEEGRITGSFFEGPDQVELDALMDEGRLSVQFAGSDERQQRLERCYELGQDGADGAPTSQDPCRVEDASLAGGGVHAPLMVGEWPWRFSALPFELAYSRQATLLWPYRSVESIDGRAPAKQEVFVVVRTAEQVSTPAGEFITWRVTVGETYTAWYAVESPHHLVAYDDGMVTWQLTDVE